MEQISTNLIVISSTQSNEQSKDYLVYILVHTIHNKTYVGITNNQNRRIRQHNGELVGGAKYTKINKELGSWKFYGFIKNLTKCQALSLEKRIKLLSRKMTGTPIEKRMKAINFLLNEINIFNKNELPNSKTVLDKFKGSPNLFFEINNE
jgi:putative endonuclease